MKLHKTTIHRLVLEKGCGCSAVREYEDQRYTKPLAEGKFTPCDKHKTQKAIVEFAGEMLLESLDKEAESAGKSLPSNAFRPVVEGDTGGVSAQGESVQTMGIANLPKRNTDGSPMQRQKRDPLQITKVLVDRPDQIRHKASDTGNLNIAAADEEVGDGITISGDIDTVAEDPRLSGVVADGLGEIEDALDELDMKDAGVPRNVLNQATD
jgi:hypothetical protein